MTDPAIAAMGKKAVPVLPNLRGSSAPQPPRTAPEPRAPEPEPKPARTRASRTAGRPSTGRDPKGVGLPAPLADRMAKAAAKARQSYGDFLLAALNRVWDKLEQEYPPLPKVRPELPPPRRTPRGQVPGGRQTVNFRLTPDGWDAIKARQDQLQVESRSEFVTTVIELDLGPAPEEAPKQA